MANHLIEHGGPNRPAQPSQGLDPLQRYARYGPLQPMEQPSLLKRIFGRAR